ncbi:Oidioi.mRNA.OKI2018_I69.chr1.g655.t2.cds [Oikopleura dioica]|uniref:Oidioi.mRNA.OKI2018_I69.chr1.g655.t2.cds n=1 Tax=Oikopleura dioica TaxID=34765 RepID=A0ABN7SL05_OIKDI|nr:Oidioi.mRNA.OKI2018_I69.chr1.g655.t2.cds [Oikopleura dioica]
MTRTEPRFRFCGSTEAVELPEANAHFLRAARSGNVEKFQFYVEEKVDINTVNTNGLSALHLASKEGHQTIVIELLSLKVDVNKTTNRGNTALHIASLAGQDSIVEKLIEAGANPNLQAHGGFTPLYMAAQEGHADIVKQLLAAKANQSIPTTDGFTPLAVALQENRHDVVNLLLEDDVKGKVKLPALHIAARKNDVKAAALLLQNEPKNETEEVLIVNRTTESGFTPLHIAAHYGNLGIASLLVSRSAGVNFVAKNGISPLHVASKRGHVGVVKMLLEKGASIAATTRDGLTPLHCAVRHGHLRVAEILLDKGAKPMVTANGLTPLHMAAQGNHEGCVGKLIKCGYSVDSKTHDLLTPLHIAAHCGHLTTAKLLLQKGADPNAVAMNGFTPLHVAAKKNRFEVVKLLLENKAKIEAVTESGLTVLMVATYADNLAVVKVLTEAGIALDALNSRGETALHVAARNELKTNHVLDHLVKLGADVNVRGEDANGVIHLAVRSGSVSSVKNLIEAGARINEKVESSGYAPVHYASKDGNLEMVQLLCSKGADLSSKTKKGFTAFHMCAKYGHRQLVRYLAEAGAQINEVALGGLTALHIAAHYGHVEVVKDLVGVGIDISLQAQKTGHDALHVASRLGNEEIVRFLLDSGAKPDSTIKQGFTSAHLAAFGGHANVLQVLVDANADLEFAAKNGLAPIHLAGQVGNLECVKFFLDKGCSLGLTKSGCSVLHLVAHYGHESLVDELLRHADDDELNRKNDADFTPLHHAAQGGHLGVYKLLVEAGARQDIVSSSGMRPIDIAKRLGYVSIAAEFDLEDVNKEEATSEGGNDDQWSATSSKMIIPESLQESFQNELKQLSDDEEEAPQDFKVMTDDSLLGKSYSLNSMQHSKSLNQYSRRVDPLDEVIDDEEKQSGFLVSFIVDARGGIISSRRHPELKFFIPEGSCPAPTRITCRIARSTKPPLSEAENQATSVVEVAPHPMHYERIPPVREDEGVCAPLLHMSPSQQFQGPVAIDVPHFGTTVGGRREVFVLSSNDGLKWHEHPSLSSEEFKESISPEDMEEPKEFVHRIITTDFPKYFALVSRPTVEYGMMGPEGGELSIRAEDKDGIASFPENALVKKIRVALQTLPINPEVVKKYADGKLYCGAVLTVEPRRRKFHKLINLSIPSPAKDEHASGLRLLYSLTEGNEQAEWEDLTNSVDFCVTKNGCLSFMTNVSARFWAIQVLDPEIIPDLEPLATAIYKEAIKIPYMTTFSVCLNTIDQVAGEVRLTIICGTRNEAPSDPRLVELARSKPIEVHQDASIWIDVIGDISPHSDDAQKGQAWFTFHPFEETQLNLRFKPSITTGDNLDFRVCFYPEPRGGGKEPICGLNCEVRNNREESPEECQLDTVSVHSSNTYTYLVPPDTIEVSDDEHQETDRGRSCGGDEEEPPITPDDLFRDIQEVKSKLAEVRQLLEGRSGSTSGMTCSQSEMHLSGYKVSTPVGTPMKIDENTELMDSVFGTICNEDEHGVLEEMEKLRSKFNERRSPEGAPSFSQNPEMTKLAGIFQARVEQELKEKEQERLIAKTANEIFNETFESIIRENSQSQKKRMSIKDRIASIETGEWRFSSDDEADEKKSQTKENRNTDLEEVNPFAMNSDMPIEGEDEEIAEFKAAETIPEMMKMTETAFDEAENIIASAETRLGEAWDHTQKILERNDGEESDEVDTVTGENSSKNTSESYNTAVSDIRDPDIGSIEDQILKAANACFVLRAFWRSCPPEPNRCSTFDHDVQKMTVSSSSSMDDVFEQELNTVALDLSLKIIQDSIEELQTEISQIDSVEKAAMNLLDDIIPSVVKEIKEENDAKIDRSEMVQNWLNDKGQSVDTVIWRNQSEENECDSVCENNTSYESDEESIVTRTLPLDMKSYGSFDQATSLTETAVAEHNLVEALVNNAIMSSITEIKREYDFVRQVQLKECVNKLVLDAIGSAILESKEESDSPQETQREEKCHLHREISEDTTIEARYEIASSSDSEGAPELDEPIEKGPCKYLLKRDSCEQFRLRNSRTCPDRHSANFASVDEEDESDDFRKVSFGSCKIYSYKVANSVDLDDVPEMDDDDLESLIESEAELYQEISKAERILQETAEKLVSKAINSSLIDLYSDRNSMASSDSDDRESPATLLNELPDPSDFVYTSLGSNCSSIAGESHGMLRLDSIAEESEHSECSLRSSSSNNLGLMQNIEQASTNRTVSYGQESVEIAEYFNNTEESSMTQSPIKMFVHQGSLQHQPSYTGSADSALSDVESQSLLGGNNSPYFRPQSPTPPASRLSGENHKNRAMAWTREESRDWRSSDDDSAQESIGTSPLFNRIQKRTTPFPFGSRSSTMDLDDGPIETPEQQGSTEQLPIQPRAGFNWFSTTLDEDDEAEELITGSGAQGSTSQHQDQTMDFEIASSIASFDTVIERENENVDDGTIDETTSTGSSPSIINLKDGGFPESEVESNYPASDDFDLVQVQPPTPTDGCSRTLSPELIPQEEPEVDKKRYDYDPIERKQSVADLLVEKMEAQLNSVAFSVDEPCEAPPGETQFDKFLEDMQRDFSPDSDIETSVSNETAVEKISDIESNEDEHSEKQEDLSPHHEFDHYGEEEINMLARMLDNIATDLVASCLDDVVHSERLSCQTLREKFKQQLSSAEIADEFDPIPRRGSTGESNPEGLQRRDTGIHDLMAPVEAKPVKRSSLEIFDEEDEDEEENDSENIGVSRKSPHEEPPAEPTFSTFISTTEETVVPGKVVSEYMTVGGEAADANVTMREFGFQNPYFDMSKSISLESSSRGDTNEQISSPAMFASENTQELPSVPEESQEPPKDPFTTEAPESERGDDMESLNSTFSPSSSILDFRQDPRNTQSLTGSIERRLRCTSRSSASTLSSGSSLSRRSKYSDSTIVSRNRKKCSGSAPPSSDRFLQLKSGVFTYRMSPDEENRFGRSKSSNTVERPRSDLICYSDSEEIFKPAASEPSLSMSTGDLSSPKATNLNRSNNSSSSRLSIGEIIFGQSSNSTSATSSSYNSAMMY